MQFWFDAAHYGGGFRPPTWVEPNRVLLLGSRVVRLGSGNDVSQSSDSPLKRPQSMCMPRNDGYRLIPSHKGSDDAAPNWQTGASMPERLAASITCLPARCVWTQAWTQADHPVRSIRPLRRSAMRASLQLELEIDPGGGAGRVEISTWRNSDVDAVSRAGFL
jgi:hypothetical protein